MLVGFTDAKLKHVDISLKTHKSLTLMENGNLFL